MIDFTPRSVVKESAAEVKDKLKKDISRWTRVRRVASIKPMMGCVACDAAGHIECESCGGTGKNKVVLNEKPEDCVHCDGKGQVTCVECAGVGLVPNVHRKKILWLLGIGGAAWLIVLWVFFGRDVMPEQRSKYLAGGVTGGTVAGRGGAPRSIPSPEPPMTGPGSPGYSAAPQTPASPTPVLPQRGFRQSVTRPGSGSAAGTGAGGPGFGTPMTPGGR